jgi:hypothetical protein
MRIWIGDSRSGLTPRLLQDALTILTFKGGGHVPTLVTIPLFGGGATQAQGGASLRIVATVADKDGKTLGAGEPKQRGISRVAGEEPIDLHFRFLLIQRNRVLKRFHFQMSRFSSLPDIDVKGLGFLGQSLLLDSSRACGLTA